MRDSGTTFRLKLVALGVAAALTSTAAYSQLDREPASPGQDRGSISGDSSSQRQTQQPGQTQSQQPGALDERQASSQQTESEGSDALQAITDEHDNLGTFVEALEAAGLEDSLTGGTEYTVFAPTDEAFEAMGKSKEELLDPSNREELVSMLRAHIVADDVDPEMARTLREARTIDGGSVSLSAEGEELMVGDATVVESDIQQGNLRVYAIDQVLESNAPEQAASADEEEELGEQPAAAVRESESPIGSRGAEADTETEPRPN